MRFSEKISCLYHIDGSMRVVEDYDKSGLLETGMWFSHPNEAKKAKELDHGQIRRSTEQRTCERECSSTPITGRTQRQRPVRQKD